MIGPTADPQAANSALQNESDRKHYEQPDRNDALHRPNLSAIMKHRRLRVWQRILPLSLLLGIQLAGRPAQAVDAIIATPETKPGCYLLNRRTNDVVLLDFATAGAPKQLIAPKDFTVKPQSESVAVTGPMKGSRQNLIVTSGPKPWDLSDYLYLVADLHNGGRHAVTVICRAEDPEYAGWHHYSESVARIGAGESTSVLIFLKRKNAPGDSLRTLFPGMDTLPDGYMPHWSGLDPARISKLIFGLESPGSELRLELRSLRGIGICNPAPLMAPDYFPFIDPYGQFRYTDWPTKIHSSADFATQRTQEAAALQASPRPASWDKYGGYQAGPQLPASGNFRVEKYAGKWWLVDPDGRLFWSHGVDCVGFANTTPVSRRESFFLEVPKADSRPAKVANWYLANVQRKYGDHAEAKAAALAHERLSAWGLNTVASWSDGNVTAMDKTPYTKMLYIGSLSLAPHLRLPDPYDPRFAISARRSFEAERYTTGTDPWCIGYFIGNELEWRGGPDLINEVLTAPAKQPGKQALVKLLQQRHATIADLNLAWHTAYDSWDSLLNQTTQADPALALADFTAFNEELATRYYQTVQTELKLALPNKLNLGSRFNTVNPITVRAAARYCDVVSFNKYETSIRNLRLPDGIDRPIIIGEFHFPAWDRSFAANAESGPLSEVQRADGYWYYVSGALDNPQIVGTHWFQYLDQPLTGRGDGENFAIGFVDVTDTPYDELTRVTRDLGDQLYSRRLAQTAP